MPTPEAASASSTSSARVSVRSKPPKRDRPTRTTKLTARNSEQPRRMDGEAERPHLHRHQQRQAEDDRAGEGAREAEGVFAVGAGRARWLGQRILQKTIRLYPEPSTGKGRLAWFFPLSRTLLARG